MKLKVSEALALAAAIRQLGGKMALIKEGGNERAVLLPYEFGGAVRMVLAKNLRNLALVEQDFSEARDALINEFSGGTGRIDAEHPRYVDLNAEMVTLGRREVDIDISQLRDADLKLDKNPIPPSVLADLMSMID